MNKRAQLRPAERSKRPAAPARPAASAKQPARAGVLYVVAMPIGNPADLSPRALEVLRSVDLIACEDTRRLRPLLAARQIAAPAVSYFEHNESRRARALAARLAAGASIALVSDAGTPAVADPGLRLVGAAHEAGCTVTAVPGPSAVIAALSIAGIATDRFTFEGFLPAQPPARRRLLESLAGEPRTMVFFEAARRAAESVAEMARAFGAERLAALVREMTKTFESVLRGSLAEIAAQIAAEPLRGEITLVVAGRPKNRLAVSAEPTGQGAPLPDPMAAVNALCQAGLSLKQASASVAKLTGLRRRDLYQAALSARQRQSPA